MAKRVDGDLPKDHERLGAMTMRLMMACANWSNRKLSQETGYDPKLIALWIAGRRDPKPEQLAAVADAIGVSLEWFENVARTAIRLGSRDPEQKVSADFPGPADRTARDVAAVLEAQFPEIVAIIESETMGIDLVGH